MDQKKRAATEEDVAYLHSLITKVNNKKAEAMLKLVAQAEENLGEQAAEIILTIIDTRQLSSLQKWVEYNGVKCALGEDDGETELNKRLREIREKQTRIVNAFDEEDDETQPSIQ